MFESEWRVDGGEVELGMLTGSRRIVGSIWVYLGRPVGGHQQVKEGKGKLIAIMANIWKPLFVSKRYSRARLDSSDRNVGIQVPGNGSSPFCNGNSALRSVQWRENESKRRILLHSAVTIL